ncbi:protein ANTAGONIST OF LIKE HETEROCHROMATIN PROTEIN 1-like [Dendronephthya gigantea]|uniref:protein ANTAGONIST OF LIKE HETEROCHROMATIN PROTEIN 1-like n=1 Tax=Dendronephthya gigantea TaxID=151771 RepID=UPI00106D46F1|nr:protein ANTAGONIST OF LIKE HETEROCHROMATIN PROTEIN 1-like [Dendronephthya gigantea]
MAPNSNKCTKILILNNIIHRARQRRKTFEAALHFLISRRQKLLKICAVVVLLLSARNSATTVKRSCRRFQRNPGWWNIVWQTYSDARFKKTFRVSRGTFSFILGRIRTKLERKSLTEEPVEPALRLAICLYRLGRGTYYYTISELCGLGLSTVATITREVSEAIVEILWEDSVNKHMPNSEETFREKILDMEEMWQFPCCWAAVDGCHIPIKCPPGGMQACKEYHNFKNFYSIVLMALVDSHYRFIWGSCGYPGNSHDSIILQSTELWSNIEEGDGLPSIGKKVGTQTVPPLIVGDSAFPLAPWLMKPYTNAVLSPEQRYFNYRLSRARMVTEGAYGQLKGRWRVLLRKCESDSKNVRIFALACMVLHNICINLGDTMPKKLDLTIDPTTSEKRDREKIREILQMTNCSKVNNSSPLAEKIRMALVEKLWLEKETGFIRT